MSQDNVVIESKNTFGGWFEDFEKGQLFKHWPGKTITEMDNHLFSLLTMNDNPLHTDANYMSEHQHGKILCILRRLAKRLNIYSGALHGALRYV